MRIEVHSFDALTPAALYDVLRLRAEVFVVEQDCPYLDPDGVDAGAVHVLGREDGVLVAYARVADEDGLPRISRVVTSPRARGRGLGHAIVRACLEVVGDAPCFLNAQDHLRAFYVRHGFAPVGDVFLEDDIPHIRMHRNGRN